MIRSAKLKTKLTNIFPHGTKTHRISDGDFKWEFMLCLEDVSFPNGDTGSGYMLCFSNFFGDVSFPFGSEETLCSVSSREQWLGEIMDIISQEG